MNIAPRNLLNEPNLPRKRGLLKTETTSRSILWSVANYLPLLTFEKSICSDTFRVPTLSNSLFYLCLSLSEDLLSLNVIKTMKKLSLSTATRNPIKITVIIRDVLNQIELTKELYMQADNITLPINFEVKSSPTHTLVNEACLDIQCSVINIEMETFVPFKSVLESQESKVYVPSISSNELREHLQVILEGEVHNNVTISVGDELFQVHKTMICSHSPVFAAMFEHDTLEKAKSRIYIDDISADTLKEMISFIYFGSTSQMSHELAMDLYAAADKYAMTDLKRRCSNFLTKNLTKELVLDVLIMADRHADQDLKTTSIQFLVNEASDIIEMGDFLEFLETESELARSIILHLVKIVTK